MPYAKVNDINMYYEIHGEGEPLVLIWGWGSNTNMSSPHFPVLSEHYKVIAIDNRGAGKSDKPDIPYTMEIMASDIAKLLEIIEVDKAHILGASMGGGIAQFFALDYPDKVISLILACTAPGLKRSIPSERNPLTRLSPEERAKQSPEETIKGIIDSCLTEEFIKNNPERVEYYISLLSTNPPNPIGMKRQSEAMLEAPDIYDSLPDITAPTLVIAGDKDITVNPENSRLLASIIPNSELVLMKNLGHSFDFEAPEEFRGILLDFLKRHSQK